MPVQKQQVLPINTKIDAMNVFFSFIYERCLMNKEKAGKKQLQIRNPFL